VLRSCPEELPLVPWQPVGQSVSKSISQSSQCRALFSLFLVTRIKAELSIALCLAAPAPDAEIVNQESDVNADNYSFKFETSDGTLRSVAGLHTIGEREFNPAFILAL